MPMKFIDKNHGDSFENPRFEQKTPVRKIHNFRLIFCYRGISPRAYARGGWG